MSAICREMDLLQRMKTERMSVSARRLPPSAKGLPSPVTVCQDLPGTATWNGVRAGRRDPVVRRARTSAAVDLTATSSFRSSRHRIANRTRIKSEGFIAEKRDLASPQGLSPPATSRNQLKEHANETQRSSFNQAASRGFDRVRVPPDKTRRSLTETQEKRSQVDVVVLNPLRASVAP